MFSKHIDMHQNRFRENWGPSSYGLLLKEINDAEIFDNIFEKNTIGINVEGTNRVTYRRNNFQENGWAIRRSEEHTSELQSRGHLVCRLLLEKKKIITVYKNKLSNN